MKINSLKCCCYIQDLIPCLDRPFKYLDDFKQVVDATFSSNRNQKNGHNPYVQVMSCQQLLKIVALQQLEKFSLSEVGAVDPRSTKLLYGRYLSLLFGKVNREARVNRSRIDIAPY